MVQYNGLKGNSFKKEYSIHEYVSLIIIFGLGTLYTFYSYNQDLRVRFSSILLYSLIIINLYWLVFYSLKKIIVEKGFEIFFLIATFGVIVINHVFVYETMLSSTLLLILILFFINAKHTSIPVEFYKIFSYLMMLAYIYYSFVDFFTIYINLNIIGYAIVMLSIYTLIVIQKWKYNRVLSLIVVCNSMYQILQTESRGAIVSFVIFIFILYLVPSKFFDKNLFNFLMFVTFSIGSIIFCLIYIKLWEKGVSLKISFTDKSFYTGRELIWAETLQAFINNPFTGIGAMYTLESFETLNIHNSFFTILSVYGIFGFILIVCLMWNRINNILKYVSEDKTMKIIVSGIYSFLAVGFFENYLITLSFILPIFILIFYSYSLKNQILKVK